MVKELVLTGIKDLWPKPEDEKRCIFLGPWCFTNNPAHQFFEYPQYEIAQTPWDSLSDIVQQEKIINKFIDKLIPILSNKLDELLDVEMRDAYWRYATSGWIAHFVAAICDRYSRLKYFDDKRENFSKVKVKILGSLTLSEYEKINLFDLYHDHYANLILMSDILRHENWKSLNLVETKIEKDNSTKCNTISWHRKILKSIYYGSERLIKSQTCLGNVYGLSLWDNIRLALLIDPFVFLKKRKFIFKKNNISSDIRSKLKFDCYENNLEKIVCNLLPKYIPDNLLSVCRYTGNKIKIFFSFGSLYDIDERHKLAAILASGGKIMGAQHGGIYGQLATSQYSRVEYDTCHQFINWGWSTHLGYQSSKFINLPSPLISKLVKKYKNRTIKNSCLLYVTSIGETYFSRFTTSLLPEQKFNYVERKILFIKFLENHILNKFTYRPYFYDPGNNEIEFIQNQIGFNLKLLLGGNIYKLMHKYKIIIFDHPFTGYLIRLAVNMPMVLCYDRNHFLMSEEADQDMNELRKVNVVFDDPKDAAAHINKVHSNIDLWWSSQQVQDAIKIHVRKYALNSSRWFEDWKNFIRGMI
ncbi:MAG: hypothetical protein HQK49_10735 [Oligoflexia bacterium]|nr:hypothetical protein [Oligoflexia bacterium]